jgi:hypothetical protein
VTVRPSQRCIEAEKLSFRVVGFRQPDRAIPTLFGYASDEGRLLRGHFISPRESRSGARRHSLPLNAARSDQVAPLLTKFDDEFAELGG